MSGIIVTYESYKGGVNNLAVAIDAKTGEWATSTISKERAIKNLKSMFSRRDLNVALQSPNQSQ